MDAHLERHNDCNIPYLYTSLYIEHLNISKKDGVMAVYPMRLEL